MQQQRKRREWILFSLLVVLFFLWICSMKSRSRPMEMSTSIPLTDKEFAAQMIPHHQSALQMAKHYLEGGQAHNKALIQLAHNILKTQTQEIHVMQNVLS